MGKEEENMEASIHGDVLDTVFSLLPLLDLLAASRVSRSWKLAVASSLSHPRYPSPPWLICHVQSPRAPFLTNTRAYDPRSHNWIKIESPLPPPQSTTDCVQVRSSHPALLYALSLSAFSFSTDPLHLTWRRAAGAPRVWRTDPVIALVGQRVVVAGGACEFEDDKLVVEAYDVSTHTWRACPSMPASLKSSATWISAAVHGGRLFLMENETGVTHALDAEAGTWSGPFDLKPDSAAVCSAVEFAGGKMILVSVLGGGGGDRGVIIGGVNVYEVDQESFEVAEIGEMPEAFVEKMRGEGAFAGASIRVCAAEGFVYMHNPGVPEEVVFCELQHGGNGGGGGGSGVTRWGSVRNPMLKDMMGRVMYSCSKVGLDDLQRARVEVEEEDP